MAARRNHDLRCVTSIDPEAVVPDVRRAVREVLKTVPVTRVTTLGDQVDASIVPERLIATLSGSFGALGALLAAIGLYGLLAYTVARRINEIGIRMALGATRSAVTRMVLGDALWHGLGGPADRRAPGSLGPAFRGKPGSRTCLNRSPRWPSVRLRCWRSPS